MQQKGSTPIAVNEIFNNQHNKLSWLPNLETKNFEQRNTPKKKAK